MNVELLEERRLLSFTTIGTETSVPGTASVTDYDLAVAGNGTYMVAAVTEGPSANTATISAVRYSKAGDQIGSTLTLPAVSGIVQFLRAAVDADGDGIVAYTVLQPDSTSGPESVYFVRISKDGVASAAVQASAPLAHADDYIFYPALSMDAGGGCGCNN